MSGECLHCYMYLGPAAIPTPDDPDYIHTEHFLRDIIGLTEEEYGSLESDGVLE